MSTQSVASAAITLTPPNRNSLAHVPGDEGWPIIGRTLAVLADPKGEVERMAAKHGLIYRSRVLGETSITLLGPEANELVLFDQARLFSSTYGWGTILGRLFPRGLMLLDFEEHRLHRRALSVAFKSGPMKSYLASLDAGIAERVAQWRRRPGAMLFYPAMKQLTLDLAATSFLGTTIGPDVKEITRAFVDMVAARLENDAKTCTEVAVVLDQHDPARTPGRRRVSDSCGRPCAGIGARNELGDLGVVPDTVQIRGQRAHPLARRVDVDTPGLLLERGANIRDGLESKAGAGAFHVVPQTLHGFKIA